MRPTMAPALLSTLTAALLCRATAAQQCVGEYELCINSGSCALDASLCGTCKTGEYLCPGSNTCVSSADAVVDCPLASPLYNWSAPLSERISATVSLLTAAEKASLIIMVSPGVLRLGIPTYNFWTEAQHGWIGDGIIPASSSPATGALANSFSPQAFFRAAEMAALESRGQHNAAVSAGRRTENFFSSTVFSPETNLVRAPLWGRAQEATGGEDPLLTGRHAAAFVRGMQQTGGDTAGRLLVTATCKDFPVYDYETHRFSANATLSPKDLAETYLPPFIACAAAAGAAAVMSTYYSVQLLPAQPFATPVVANAAAQSLLRSPPAEGGMGWEGAVMCDCDAILGQLLIRHTQPDRLHAAAAALLGGTDMELSIPPERGYAYTHAPEAVASGLVPAADLDAAAARALTLRALTGSFDPPSLVPFTSLGNGTDNVLSPVHVQLCRELAAIGALLLKNDGGALPLSSLDYVGKKVALIGPAIDNGYVMLGDYSNFAAPVVSIAQAANASLPGAAFAVAHGCEVVACRNASGFAAAEAAAAGAAVVVLQLGLCSDACKSPGQGGPQEQENMDRPNADLPGLQPLLAAVVRAAAPRDAPIVCVLFHGGVLDLTAVLPFCSAVLSMGYPGMQGGPATWDVLLGAAPPAGRASTTWYTSAQIAAQAPPTDYDLYSTNGTGRTYRFASAASASPPTADAEWGASATGAPLFPFGFGLTYSSFQYSNLTIFPASSREAPLAACTPLEVGVTLCNTGQVDSDEVAQLYTATPEGPLPAPTVRLAEFTRSHVTAGACLALSWSLPPVAWAAATAAGELRTQSGRVPVSVGGGQPGYTPGVQSADVFFGQPQPLSACSDALEMQKAYYGGSAASATGY